MIQESIGHGEGRRKLAFPLFVLGLLLLAWAPSCGDAPTPTSAPTQGEQALRLQGSTMGTTWSASLHGADPEVDWSAVIQAELDEIETALTTWNAESELMRFNAWRPDEVPAYFPAGEHLLDCFDLAWRYRFSTQGAFDPSIQPLVDLWGFGSERERPLPSEQQVNQAREQSFLMFLGYGNYPPEDHIPKAVKGMELDFSAFAKGYAADLLVEIAGAEACRGGLIEVGGEIRVFGERSDGGPWRIGVESPAEHPGAPKVIGTVLAIEPSWNLKAVATSGDSRNRRTIGDYTFSHIIDPRTGWPLVDPPASVTVVAPDCATADAWATALMVLGPEEGLPLATEHGLEVCFQLRNEDGSYRELATEGYEPLVAERLNR
ncbi:MAG: hypothetical protein CMJ94_16090 [Planctomycetes bacterium]|nr:hypothetical protein [Planctomycetota bacterium]